MLGFSVGTVTNCSAASLIVPYTFVPGGGTLGKETTVSGITTPARSSVVILIASPSFGLGIVAFLTVWIGRGRRGLRGWMVGIGLGGGGSLAFRPGFGDDLAGLDINEWAVSRIKETGHDLHSRKDIPSQSKSERRRSQVEKNLGNQPFQRRI